MNEQQLQEKALKEVLLEQYKKLPKVLQNAITSVKTGEIVQSIGKKHDLHIDQIGELIDETWLVLLGIVRSSDFVGDLKIRLTIDEQKAREITKDINEQIFNEVKSALVEAEKIDIKQEEQAGEQTLQSPEGVEDVPPSRENILAEIEGGKVEVPQQAKQEIVGDLEQGAENTTSTENVGKENNTQNIMEEKLGGEFSVPHEQKTLSNENGTADVSKKYEQKIAHDPYREPID